MLTTSTGRMSKQQVQVVRPTFMTLDHKNEVECISVVSPLVSCPVFLTWALVLHTNCRELTSRFRWQRLPLLTHCCHCSGGSSESGEIHRRQWRRRHLFNGRTTKSRSPNLYDTWPQKRSGVHFCGQSPRFMPCVSHLGVSVTHKLPRINFSFSLATTSALNPLLPLRRRKQRKWWNPSKTMAEAPPL